MFIKVVKKYNADKSKTFHQFQLAQSIRINNVVKQNVLLHLGSDNDLIEKGTRDQVLVLLKSKIFQQPLLFPIENKVAQTLANKYFLNFQAKFPEHLHNYEQLVSTPPKMDGADYQEIDTSSIDVISSKNFGAENIGNQIYDVLNFDDIFSSFAWNDEQKKMARLSILSRAIYTSSEYKTAQILNQNSSLLDLLNINKTITHRDLYPVLDHLYEYHSQIDKALYEHIKNLFNVDTSLVIYDLSNLYFEGRKANSQLAKYGRSKEKRNDCKQVVFTGIIDSEGFIKHSRIYEGNKVDCKTLEDLLEDFSKQGVQTNGVTIVMDAGFATEENLTLLEKKGMKYVSVARNKIKDFQIENTEDLVKIYDKKEQLIELKIIKSPLKSDTWMYVKSHQKKVKESSMYEKLEQKWVEELTSLNNGLNKKGTTKLVLKIYERIGRIKERHSLVSGRYDIKVGHTNNKATSITWIKKQEKIIEDEQKGIYFIRTNYKNIQEKELWDIYNLIREVESTFRCLKSDLLIRPVYHQKDERIKGHIYQTILAYQIVNAIRFYLKKKEINHDWQNILRIAQTQTLKDIKLPTKTKNILITKASKPIEELNQIYQALSFKTTIKPKKKYVVYH